MHIKTICAYYQSFLLVLFTSTNNCMPLKFLHLLRAFSQNYYIVNFTYLINVYKEDIKGQFKFAIGAIRLYNVHRNSSI